MKNLLISAPLLLLLAISRISANSQVQLSPDHAGFLESARQSALDYSQRLPDFICTQVTHREIALLDISGNTPPDILVRSNSSSWNREPTEQNDVIEERLTFFDQKERYEVINVDGKKAGGVDHLQFQGAISVGEFGTDLRRIFAPESNTSFSWDREADSHGRHLYIFRFSVPKENGTTVADRKTGHKIVVSYSGQIFIDAQTFEVVRLTARLDMPENFPITAGDRMVEYKSTRIGGKAYNLPFHAEVRMRDARQTYTNRIDFNNYHKFATESTIRYGSETPQ